MQPVAANPVTITSAPPAAAPTHQPAAADPRAGAGVQGAIADLIRGSASGYQTATRIAGVQADKAAIHPFETVSTATGLLKQKTANIKGLNRATGMLHTIGGFGLLIMTANLSSGIKAPGNTAVDLGNRVADLIDGRSTAKGWSLGWGINVDPASPPSDAALAASPESTVGSALGSLGMK
jgi:hypothetical protein